MAESPVNTRVGLGIESKRVPDGEPPFNTGTAYAIGPKQYLAVQAGGRHLHPVKYDKLQDSSFLFVFALN